jgi:hypothetical protein
MKFGMLLPSGWRGELDASWSSPHHWLPDEPMVPAARRCMSQELT